MIYDDHISNTLLRNDCKHYLFYSRLPLINELFLYIDNDKHEDKMMNGHVYTK